MIQGGQYVAHVATVEGEIVGFAMAKVAEGYVFACFVRPEFEGRGIGGHLMLQIEIDLKNSGLTSAWLSTGPGEDLRAVGFYLHLGWKRNGYLDDGQIRFERFFREFSS